MAIVKEEQMKKKKVGIVFSVVFLALLVFNFVSSPIALAEPKGVFRYAKHFSSGRIKKGIARLTQLVTSQTKSHLPACLKV